MPLAEVKSSTSDFLFMLMLDFREFTKVERVSRLYQSVVPDGVRLGNQSSDHLAFLWYQSKTRAKVKIQKLIRYLSYRNLLEYTRICYVLFFLLICILF